MPNKRERLLKERHGQTITEVAIVLPLFLLLVFGVLQVGHLGIAVAIVNYGASAVARQAVEENGFNEAAAQNHFNQLLMAGLSPLPIEHHIEDIDSQQITSDIAITACAELPAYPFVGQFLDKALTSEAAGGDGCTAGTKTLGPVGLKGPAPYHFLVSGKAKARMNYFASKT